MFENTETSSLQTKTKIEGHDEMFSEFHKLERASVIEFSTGFA